MSLRPSRARYASACQSSQLAMNEYEAERQRRIEKNKAQLAALGLARTNGSSAPLGGVNLAGATRSITHATRA